MGWRWEPMVPVLISASVPESLAPTCIFLPLRHPSALSPDGRAGSCPRLSLISHGQSSHTLPYTYAHTCTHGMYKAHMHTDLTHLHPRARCTHSDCIVMGVSLWWPAPLHLGTSEHQGMLSTEMERPPAAQ